MSGFVKDGIWTDAGLQTWREQIALEEALRDWRKVLYDKGRITMQQRMDLAFGHRRAGDITGMIVKVRVPHG